MSEIRVNNVIADNGLDAVNFSKGINVSSGIITATSFNLGDSIVHTGDTNTKIRFPGADQFSIETAGSQRLLTRADGRIQITSGNFEVIGGEGGDAQLRLTADEGDDGADYWRLESKASNNNFNLATYASGAWVDKVTVNTSGSVLLGATSYGGGGAAPTLYVSGTSGRTMKIHGGSATSSLQLSNSTSGEGEDQGLQIYLSGNNAGLNNVENGNIAFATNGTERMNITSAGQLCIGHTTPFTTTTILNVQRTNGSIASMYHDGTDDNPVVILRHQGSSGGTGRHMIQFNNTSGSAVGTINSDGSGTAYNTSSDYRLKENVTAIADGITRLKTLKPSRFNFKSYKDKTVDGFLAHEVSSIVPEAITGTKDAVDSDNKPIYQGIDQSKLVPLLTAALQEAVAKIETLETKVAALEAA